MDVHTERDRADGGAGFARAETEERAHPDRRPAGRRAADDHPQRGASVRGAAGARRGHFRGGAQGLPRPGAAARPALGDPLRGARGALPHLAPNLHHVDRRL